MCESRGRGNIASRDICGTLRHIATELTPTKKFSKVYFGRFDALDVQLAIATSLKDTVDATELESSYGIRHPEASKELKKLQRASLLSPPSVSVRRKVRTRVDDPDVWRLIRCLGKYAKASDIPDEYVID